MKMKRVVAMMLLFACLFNVIIAGFSEQQSSSPIIQAVVPYLNSWDKGMGQGDGSLAPLSNQNDRLKPWVDRGKSGTEEPSPCPIHV